MSKSLSLEKSNNNLELFAENESIYSSITNFEKNNMVYLSSQTKEAIIEMAYNGGPAY